MDHELHHPHAFFGRRKGHKLRKRQAELFDTLLPVLALDLSRPAPAELHALFPVPVNEVQLEIGFGGGENMITQAAARPRTGFIGVEPFVNGMAKALAAIKGAGLQNIRLHFDDAASLIAWLPDASLARIEMQTDILQAGALDRRQRLGHAVDKGLDADESRARPRRGLRNHGFTAAKADFQLHFVNRHRKQRVKIGRSGLRKIERQNRQQRVKKLRLPLAQLVALAAAEEGARVM